MKPPKYVIFDFAFTLCSQKYFHRMGPEVEQQVDAVLFQEDQGRWANDWMAGALGTQEILAYLSQRLGLGVDDLRQGLEESCRSLEWNPAVWQFAQAQKDRGRRIALVTINMDVFSLRVVPAHRLDEMFDVIINSSQERQMDKALLWDKAFALLGPDACYANSLLIDDSIRHLTRFRENGGRAVLYYDDNHFRRELIEHGLADEKPEQQT